MSTEYPGLTGRFLAAHGVEAEVRLSHGATEAKIPEIADAVVEITETGRALRAAGLRIVDTILESYTELIANPAAYADDTKRHAMQQLSTLLHGTLIARERVLVKLNVAEADLGAVIELLPAMKSPTVSKLFGEEAFAVEAVVPSTPSTRSSRPSRITGRPTSSSYRSPRSCHERGGRRPGGSA